MDQTNDLIDTFLILFNYSQDYKTLYLVATVVGIFIGLCAVYEFKKVLPNISYFVCYSSFAGVSVLLILAAISFHSIQYNKIFVFPDEDPRCEMHSDKVLYLPLLVSDELKPYLDGQTYQNRSSTCEDFLRVIVRDSYGWTTSLTVALHLLVGVIMIACLTVLVALVTLVANRVFKEE